MSNRNDETDTSSDWIKNLGYNLMNSAEVTFTTHCYKCCKCGYELPKKPYDRVKCSNDVYLRNDGKIFDMRSYMNSQEYNSNFDPEEYKIIICGGDKWIKFKRCTNEIYDANYLNLWRTFQKQ